MNAIADAFQQRIGEVEETNHDYLVSSGLQQKYIDIFDQVKKMVPECVLKLLLELDYVMVDIEVNVQARAYRIGLIDGMTLKVK